MEIFDYLTVSPVGLYPEFRRDSQCHSDLVSLKAIYKVIMRHLID